MDPIIFNFPKRIPLTPTYGHWGAPGHDGFDRNPDGSVKRDERSRKPLIASGKDPIDDLDKCFYRHDCVYQDFADGLATKRDILIADLKLIYEVAHLDPTSKGYPTDPYALAYMDAIRPVFELKLMYDLMRIDNFNDEELNEIWRRCLKDYPNDWVDPLWDAHKAIDFSEDLFDDAAAVLPPRSGVPIVLDLDGDGVETTGLNDGAYFDHDKNGFAEKIAWAGSDDGLLAWDRNGDGIINDGAELFNVTMPDGSPAENGFQVLDALDNNQDGKIDVNDAIWNQLKIWQDIDGDGYSASDELFTLDELGIRSINTGYSNSTYADGNGNEHRQVGSYTRTDGTVLTATDVWFRTDKTYTIADEWVDVPDDIAVLPDLQGFGNTYDLHQAMAREALGGQPSDAGLKNLVEQFMVETNVAVRNTLIEQIIFKWTGSDGIDPESRGGLIDARELAALEALFGEAYAGTGGADPIQGAVPFLERSYKGVFEMYYAQLMAQTHLKDIYDMITYTWDETSQNIKGDLSVVATAIRNALTNNEAAGKVLLGEFSRTVYGFQAKDMLNFIMGFRSAFAAQCEDFAWIIDSAGKNIIAGTEGNDNLSSSEANDAIRGGDGNDSLYGTVLYGNAGTDCLSGTEDSDILSGGTGNDYLCGGGGNDVLEGGEGNDYVDGGAGQDTITGGLGNDTLSAGEGSDTYLFNKGDGQDTIYEYDATGTGIDTVTFGPGITKDDLTITRRDYDLIVSPNSTDSITLQYWYYGNEYRIETFRFNDGSIMTGPEAENRAVIRGTSGNDYLYDFDTNDTIHGGTGNDYIQGTAGGSDTYLFNKGDGQDRIYEYDATGTNTNTIKFGDGITKDDILVTREDYDLILGIQNSTDSITLQYWYCGNEYKIDTFELVDGATMTLSEAENKAVIRGTSGNDYLYDFDTNDTIHGGTGNDYIQGTAGGSDTYLFNLGDGQDRIYEYDATGTGIDTVTFGPGITKDDLTITRRDYDLIVSPNSTDSITLQYWYYGNEYRIETFRFNDGSIMTGPEAENRAVIRGTSGNDYLYDFDTNDTIHGGTGNDYIQGTAGGNDTYLFNKGDGQDRIYEYDATGTGIDTVTFGPGITKDDLTITRRDYDLILSVGNLADSITLQYWYCGNEYKIDTLEFNDGTSMTRAEIESMAVVRGTDEDDCLSGFDTGEVFDAATGNDYIYGYGGNDTIAAGIGSDYLDGGDGSDTYRFSSGDGSDTISDTGYDGAFDSIGFANTVSRENIAFFRNDTTLHIAYGGTDCIAVFDQDTTGIERIQTSEGLFLTADDINALIQQITAYAANNGLALTSAYDVRNNNELMSIIVNAWHQ